MKHITPSVLSLFGMQLMILSLATPMVDTLGTESTCAYGKSVTFSFRHTTNKTGHTVIQGRLEEPINTDWNLDVDLKTSTCETAELQKNVLSFELTNADKSNDSRLIDTGKILPKKTMPKKQAPPGYSLLGKLGYFRQGSRRRTWMEARDECASVGAHLAFATSQEEAKMYKPYLDFGADGPDSNYCAWYGASDREKEGTYVTVTGVSLNETGYAEFDQKDMDHSTDANCLRICKKGAVLDNAPCSYEYVYICKISLLI